MSKNKTRQYTDNQYNRTPDHELGSVFSNYERLMVELNNREVIGIPCYASVMKDGLAESNNMLSLINGTMEFITESNSLSRHIQIDETFNAFGRTYKVNNIYYKDGILHVIVKDYIMC